MGFCNKTSQLAGQSSGKNSLMAALTARRISLRVGVLAYCSVSGA